jgi:hypothetical protein
VRFLFQAHDGRRHRFVVTASFAFLGDSTLDFGNLSATASFLKEPAPFRNKRYAGGGNVKASDGFVLGEQIVRKLGASSSDSPARLNSAELINFSNQPLEQVLSGKDPKAQVFNFAYAGSTSGLRGSKTAGLESYQIGLRQQAATLAQTASEFPLPQDLDIIISGGTNDAFDFLEAKSDKIKRVLITPFRSDNNSLANQWANRIVANIDATLDTITGLYDEAVVVGMAPLSAIPRVRSAAKKVGRTPLVGSLLRKEFLRFADTISARVNAKLDKSLNSSDDNGVFFVDGIAAWKSVKSPSFVDTIHPDSATNARLGRFVASQIATAASLDSFGL